MARELAALTHIVWEARAQEGAGQAWRWRNMNALSIERRALSAFGGKHFIAQRIVDDAQFQSSVAFKAHRNTKTRITVRVVCRAVERIDDPAPIALRALSGRRISAGFFRENRMAGVVGLNAIDDQAFRRQIRFSNQIEFALVADAQASSEPFGQHAARFTRGLNGKVEQLVSFQNEDGSIQDIPEPQTSEVPDEMSAMTAF